MYDKAVHSTISIYFSTMSFFYVHFYYWHFRKRIYYVHTNYWHFRKRICEEFESVQTQIPEVELNTKTAPQNDWCKIIRKDSTDGVYHIWWILENSFYALKYLSDRFYPQTTGNQQCTDVRNFQYAITIPWKSAAEQRKNVKKASLTVSRPWVLNFSPFFGSYFLHPQPHFCSLFTN